MGSAFPDRALGDVHRCRARRSHSSHCLGGDEVVKAKDGAGSATLSMGYTGAHFADRVMAGLSGETGVVECTFVESSVGESAFFASPCTLGKNGVEAIHDVGTITDYEKKLIADMMPDLVAQGEKGVKWAKENL